MTSDAKDPISEAITGAEDVADTEDTRDPLEGLIERARTDPSAPFEPDTLEQLAALKYDHPARFEELRTG